MSKTECIAGNTTPCQTPAVVRQAIYERHKANEWHEQPIYELEIQRRAWVASTPGVHLSGYIQKIVFYPFQVLFYLEEQVKTLITTSNSNDECTLHIDATGSLISTIGEKTGRDNVFLYSAIMQPGNIPVFEFLSADHRSVAIQSMMETFLNSVSAVNQGRRVTGLFVVVDYSYAMIHAVVKSFNECNLVTYLRTCHKIIMKKADALNITSMCIVVLCASHVIKAVSRRLHRTEPDCVRRQATMLWFVALQRTLDMSTALAIYEDIYICLRSKYENENVASAQTRLQSRCQGMQLEQLDADVC